MVLSCGALVNARSFLLTNEADLEIRAKSLRRLRDKVTPYQTCASKQNKKLNHHILKSVPNCS